MTLIQIWTEKETIVLAPNDCPDRDEDCLTMTREQQRRCASGSPEVFVDYVNGMERHTVYKVPRRMPGCKFVCPFVAD